MLTVRCPSAVEDQAVKVQPLAVGSLLKNDVEHVFNEFFPDENGHVGNVPHVFQQAVSVRGQSARNPRRLAVPGMLALLALLAASVPGRAEAESKPDAKTLRERHEQVVKMSQVERDHLQRNLAEFQQMSPEKRDHYRQLNEQLEANKKDGGQLSSLLQTYSAWLQTLTPSQREALRQETDSARKLALVQKFKDEQYSRIETFAADPEAPAGRHPFGLKLLSVPDLHAVTKILLAELPAGDQEKLGNFQKPEEYLEILKRSIHHAEGGPREWPPASLQEEILNALPVQTRNMIKRNPNNQRERLVGYLFMSVMHLGEESRPRFPKENDLKQFLDEIDAKQRAMLEQLPPEEMKGELIHRYFERQERRMQELRSALGRMRMEVGLPAAPFPGNFPRPGDRGGPDDRMGPDRFGPGRDNPRPDRPPPRREGKDAGPRKPID
jgi:hypothetical protein